MSGFEIDQTMDACLAVRNLGHIIRGPPHVEEGRLFVRGIFRKFSHRRLRRSHEIAHPRIGRRSANKASRLLLVTKPAAAVIQASEICVEY